MKTLQHLTEVGIAYVKPGITLSPTNESGAEAQAFARLVKILKAQKGCIRQYWGHQLENPLLFVWCIAYESRVDWNSAQSQANFTKSEKYSTFISTLQDVFDYSISPRELIFTYWTSDPRAAFSSGVTEVAFFNLVKDKSEETKFMTIEALKPINSAVVEHGQARGSAVGWAARNTGSNVGLAELETDMLAGIYGYDSLEDHVKWRQHPEHHKAIEIFEDLYKKDIVFAPATISGIDPNTGYFHVSFESTK